MAKICAVYNTCGLNGKDNVNYYIEAIKSILNQNFDCDVILSACLNPIDQINRIKDVFGQNIKYCLYNDKYTVNITFNKTVKEYIKNITNSEGYLYIDSGCILHDINSVSTMYEYYKSNAYGMVSLTTNSDTGFHLWFGKDMHHTFEVPIGKAINLHCQIFHPEIENRFNAIIPDVFKTYCTESVFSFVCAAVNRKWLHIMDTQVQHWHGMDGGSSGFLTNPGWWDFLPGAKSPHDMIASQEGTDCGFGYEECQSIKVHDDSKYENGLAKDPERLARFIQEWIYLPKNVLNYDEIKCEFN